MQSVVSVRGQTVIPKEVRDELGIGPKSRLRWDVTNGSAVVRVIPEDPVEALRGVLKDTEWTTDILLAERDADKRRDERAFKEMLARWRDTS